MTDKKLHPLAQLLLERMATHPDEFTASSALEDHYSERWYGAISDVENYGSDEDKEAVNAVLHKLRMDKAHERALDELFNGPARREDERRKRAEEEKRWLQQQALTAQQKAAQQYANQVSSAGNSYTTSIWNTGSYPLTPTSLIKGNTP